MKPVKAYSNISGKKQEILVEWSDGSVQVIAKGAVLSKRYVCFYTRDFFSGKIGINRAYGDKILVSANPVKRGSKIVSWSTNTKPQDGKYDNMSMYFELTDEKGTRLKHEEVVAAKKRQAVYGFRNACCLSLEINKEA